MISTTTASRRHSPERPISCQSPIADAAARLLNIASVDPITHPECVSPQLLRARPTWISPILMWPPASWASTTCNRTPGTDLAAWVRDRPRLPRRRLRSAYLNPPSPMRLRLHYHRRTRCGHVPRGHRRHRPRPAYTGREPPLKPTSSPEVHTQRGTSTNWAKPRCFKLRPPPRLAAACAVLRSAAAIPRAVVRPLDAGATSPRRKPPQWDCLAGFSQRGVRETCWKICSKNAAECSEVHGCHRRKSRHPIPHGLVGERDAALEEHLREVAKAQLIPEVPADHEKNLRRQNPVGLRAVGISSDTRAHGKPPWQLGVRPS